MAVKYYGFEKYTYQKTKTLVPGGDFGGAAISSAVSTGMPSASEGILAGRLVYNNSGSITLLENLASARAISAIADLAGKVGVVAEDAPSAPSKLVVFELTTCDIDNLVERTTPRLPKDFDGKPLYI